MQLPFSYSAASSSERKLNRIRRLKHVCTREGAARLKQMAAYYLSTALFGPAAQQTL